jgi:hypothetical protein
MEHFLTPSYHTPCNNITTFQGSNLFPNKDIQFL